MNTDCSKNVQDNRKMVNLVMQSIEEYIERDNLTSNEEGSKDLATLAKGNASILNKSLTSSQVEKNREIFGKNEFQKRKKISLLQILKEALCNQLILILSIASVVSIVVEYFAGEKKDIFWIDGASIMIAVLICVLLSTVSNFKKEKKFDELDQMTESTYNYEVLRDGIKTEVHRTEIVVGDLVFIVNGMEIPADCVLIHAINVIVNESAITGESSEVYKDVLENCLELKMDPRGPTPLMISGSNIVSGEGLMMAVVIGKESQSGKSFELIFESEKKQEEEKTAMELQLEKLASLLGRIGFFAAIFILIVLIVRLLIEEIAKGNFNIKNHLGEFIHYIIIAVTVVVVTIPEGLPLAVTITLAYTMRAMHKDKILVRKLTCCETMGAAKYVCSDKTGTITQNKMNVMHIVNLKGVTVEEFETKTLHKSYCSKLAAAIFHNTSANVESEKGPQTEIALLKLARKMTGNDEIDVRKEVGLKGYFKRIPFDSSRKRMTTGITHENEDLLFMNGASEQILETCESLLNYETNEIVTITEEIRKGLHQELEEMAGEGLRTVSVAFKSVNKNEVSEKRIQTGGEEREVLEDIEKSGFILLGIFGIEDPPRPESKLAIENCRKAGIKVIMVTGDNKITAENIAEDVGIIENGKGKVMEANELIHILSERNMLEEEKDSKNKKIIFRNHDDEVFFQELIDDLVVMARSRPEHKYILVDGINKLGHIIGVTGDGANDAPALMRADIGIAMGETGTQVAKNASDIIILDDRFDSIVRAVVWGRNVYSAIRRFLQFQLTVNLIAVSVTLVSAAIIRQTVLASVQLLWINLIMDSVAVVALATEAPNSEELLSQQPNTPDERLVTKTMLKHIIGQSIFQLTILMLLLFFGPSFLPEYRDEFDNEIGQDLEAKYLHGISESTMTDGKYFMSLYGEGYREWFLKYNNYSRHFTFLFNTFVFMQMFNFVCCRRIKDELNFFDRIFQTKEFWIVIFVLVTLQAIVVTFTGRFFELYKYGLHPIHWLISVGFGTLVMPFSLFLRLIPLWKPEEIVYERKKGQRYNKKKGEYECI